MQMDQKVKGKVIGASHGDIEDNTAFGNRRQSELSETKYASFMDRFRPKRS
jgi:hypothetical protein